MTTVPVPAPGDVEARLAEEEWASVKSAAMKSIGCNGYGDHGWIGDALRREVTRVIATHVADEVARTVVPLRRYFEAHAVTAQATGRDDRDWLDALALLDQAEAKS